MRLLSSTSILLPSTTLRFCKPADRVRSDYWTHKWEAFRVHGTGLHQKLVSPAIQGIEALRVVDIVDENAAVGAAIEGHTQRLEPLLTRRVP